MTWSFRRAVAGSALGLILGLAAGFGTGVVVGWRADHGGGSSPAEHKAKALGIGVATALNCGALYALVGMPLFGAIGGLRRRAT